MGQALSWQYSGHLNYTPKWFKALYCVTRFDEFTSGIQIG